MTMMGETATRDDGTERRSRPTAVQDILPLFFTYSVVIISWLGFGFSIIVKDALIHRHDPVRAAVLFSISGTLFGLTILSLLTASTRQAGQPDPDLTPDEAREAQARKEWDEDDIPLGRLRKGRRQNLRLASAAHVGRTSIEGSVIPSSGSSGYSPEVSPFPLNVSPFVPTTASDAGEDTREAEVNHESGSGESGDSVADEDIQGGDGQGDEDRLLAASKQDPSPDNRKSIFAKNSSGGHRWCSKCDAWKPDRCHHCRFCKRCTLKRLWIITVFGSAPALAITIPFLLFLSYSTLLSLSIFIASVSSMIHYLTHPEDYTSDSPSGMEVSELTPVSFMLLTFIGAFFIMTIGGLAGYHWYLVCNNKTTLEDITHTYPSALIEDRPHDPERQSGWRGDHLLTRPERARLREEASALNVYDLGWRRNIRELLIGSGQRGITTYLSCFWPLIASHDRLDRSAGHYFEYDPIKLERLQDLTIELRLGQRRQGDEDVE